LRKRVTLAQFYDIYTNAQANPRTFLSKGRDAKFSVDTLTVIGKRKRKRKRKRKLLFGSNSSGRRYKLSTLVQNRIIDVIFLDTLVGDAHVSIEEELADRAEMAAKKKVAEQKL
jgi:hypothetical protein